MPRIRPLAPAPGRSPWPRGELGSPQAVRWTPPLLWAAAIFYLSSQSRPLGRRWPTLPSALAHVFEFGVLAALLHRALATEPQRRERAAVPAFALTVLYAASDEVHQLFVPERTASLAEYGLDLLGASLGAGLAGRVPAISTRALALLHPGTSRRAPY